MVERLRDDAELLARIEALYRESYSVYYRVALGMLRDRDSAHDAVQETFARAVRGRSSFRGSGSLRGWVWRSLSRICLDQLRAPVPRGELMPAVTEMPESDNATRVAVAALPERQRLAVFLRYYADLSYEEIAQVLEIERGTVAATLHAARKALLPAIEEVAQ